MRKTLLIALVATLLAVGSGMFIRASADPEIGQPAVGYRLPISKLDTKGDDSVLRDWTPAEKYFTLTVRLKRGTPGRFIQVSSSMARIKLTNGEVVKARGYFDDTRRRLMFVLAPQVPSSNVQIDPVAKRFVIVATNHPLGKVVVGPVRSFGIYSESN